MAINLTGNETQIGAHTRWEPEPTRRGTYNILSTCIITLTLCLWSAVHINVPEFHQKTYKLGFKASTWRKLGWSVLAWVVPELVAFVAWGQRQEAKQIRNEFNKHLPHLPKPWWHMHSLKTWAVKGHDNQENDIESGLQHEPCHRQHWKLLHGFVAAMGGLAVELPSATGAKQKEFLTYDGVLFLARFLPEVLPQLSTGEIEDESKADAMTKSIACLQVAWFCAQTLHRIAKRLPVSLLELHTLAHAICALIIYLLWWNKPFDLLRPFVIRSNDTNGTFNTTLSYFGIVKCGLKGSQAEVPNPGGFANNDIGSMVPSEDHKLVGIRLTPTDKITAVSFGTSAVCGAQNGRHSTESCVGPPQTSSQTTEPPDPSDLIASSHELHHIRTTARPNGSTDGPALIRPSEDGEKGCRIKQGVLFPGNVFRNAGHDTVTLDPNDVANWELISDYYAFACQNRRQYILRSMVSRQIFCEKRIENSFQELTKSFYVILLVNSIIYGGLHALVWTGDSDSGEEKTSWRLGVVAIMRSFPGMFVIFFGGGLMAAAVFVTCARLKKSPKRRSTQDSDDRTRILIKLLKFSPLTALSGIGIPIVGVLAFFLFGFGRAYFIVESFIQLFHVPQGVFEVPSWSQKIPHMS